MCDTFSTHAGHVYDDMDIDCWAQNVSAQGRVFATSERRLLRDSEIGRRTVVCSFQPIMPLIFLRFGSPFCCCHLPRLQTLGFHPVCSCTLANAFHRVGDFACVAVTNYSATCAAKRPDMELLSFATERISVFHTFMLDSGRRFYHWYLVFLRLHLLRIYSSLVRTELILCGWRNKKKNQDRD